MTTPTPATSAITRAATARQLNPLAMIAVAHSESGLNPRSVGDGGHAFGLFQNNNAGGTITGDPNPQRFFDPNVSANYAGDAIAKLGISGLPAEAQIRQIVQRYERPADPQGEIARSLAYYRQLAGGAAPMGRPAPVAAPRPMQTLAQSTTPAINPLAIAAYQQTQASGQAIQQRAQDALGAISGNPKGVANPIDMTPYLDIVDKHLASTLVSRMAPATAAAIPQHAALGGMVNKQNLGRTDQGVDFRGAGAIPAFANGVVTRVSTAGTGWPGAHGPGDGAMITYKLTSGPHAGKYVYVAEALVPHVKVGQKIAAGQPIATALGTGSMTEMGFAADANGTTLARAQRGYGGGQVSSAGQAFLRYLGMNGP